MPMLKRLPRRDTRAGLFRRVWEMTEGFRRLAGGINLKCMNPIIVLATSDIVDEIVALHRIADNITHFLNEHCDAVACVFYPDGFDCTCHYAADTMTRTTKMCTRLMNYISAI